MKLKDINKKKVLLWFLVVWFIASVFYFSWLFLVRRANLIFQSGYSSALNDLLTQAENEECSSFSIFIEERRAELINIECLQQTPVAEETVEQQAPATEETEGQ